SSTVGGGRAGARLVVQDRAHRDTIGICGDIVSVGVDGALLELGLRAPMV
ncbi:MAG: hypothetical protein JWO77_311, partial [Ilumatobacteraceae bacterium]|nr:hypothetical protein [Ilumatobacteraceae bacterium]